MTNLRLLKDIMDPVTTPVTVSVYALALDERSTVRERPATEERVADRMGGPSSRFFFLPHPDAPLADPEDVRQGMRKMFRDPYVKTAWMTQVLTVASQDFQVHAADESDQLARQQAEFVERCLKRVQGGMVEVAITLLNPLGPDGYTIAEKVFEPVASGRDKGRVRYRALKSKSPSRVRIRVDRFNNPVGVEPVGESSVTYPMSDFVFLKYFGLYDAPEGMAAFRAAYGAYWMRDTVMKLRIIHHEKKIGGMLVGTYQNPADKAGLDDALARAKNATWMSIPEGVRVEALALSTASDTEYQQFVDSCNVDIVTGIAFASLQILQGQTTDARGDTKVQKSTSDLAAWYLTSLLQYALDTQLVPDLIDYNFPRVPDGEYPTVTFGAVSNQELVALADLVSRAQQIGLKPSRKYYAKALGIQEADPNDPDDQLQLPGQQGMGMGGMPGMPGMGGTPFGGGPLPQPQPFGQLGGGAPPPDPTGGDPMAMGGQPEGLFSEAPTGRWVEVDQFAWQQGKRGGRYWLPAGKPDLPANRLYGARGEAAAKAAQEAARPKASGAASSEARPEESKPAGVMPQQTLAEAVAQRIREGKAITAAELFAAANKAYGMTRAEGGYGPSDAYDALEAGFNAAAKGKTDPRLTLEQAIEQARQIKVTVDSLPTQTNRSGNKDAFQQFSTPPHLAYAVAWLANLKPSDTVLEPSAGTGSIAVHALNAGATVFGNELDPKRAALLEQLLGVGRVTRENAEQIGAILSGKVNPSVVVMNPPFSQTAGRLGDKKDILIAGRHIDEALALLPEGGRLVAIVGEGMMPPGSDPLKRGRGDVTGARHAPWFNKLMAEYDLRAAVAVPGGEYAKSGTTFGTRVLVIDKRPPSGSPVVGTAADVPQLMEMLADVRNSRPSGGPQAAGGMGGQPAVGGVSGAATGATVSDRRGAGVGGRPGVRGGGAAGSGVLGGDRLGGGDVAGGTGVGGDGSAGGGLGTARASGGRGRGRGKSGGDVPPAVPGLRPAVKVSVEAAPPASVAADAAGTQADLTESVYATWRPSVRVPGAQPLPANIVESAAMAAVPRPPATYQPTLSPDVVEKGMLSDVALENVVYAGQAHQAMLSGGTVTSDGVTTQVAPARRGYFIGDGTGVGKGRQIAGVISDNLNQGRKKHVWVSLSPALLQDAQRDWEALGQSKGQLRKFDHASLTGPTPPADGVTFLTYAQLRNRPDDPEKPSNVDALVNWLGADFDGVIAFDEAHAMGNAMAGKGRVGTTQASKQAMAGLELQRKLPNARVVYVSATGATELRNLAYAERLGLWGPNTAFPTRESFLTELDKGGVAAMESVAQTLKASGLYSARSISLGSDLPPGDPQAVKYDRVTHQLTDDQRAVYDAAADAWQEVLKNVDKAVEVTAGGPRAKMAARSQFWGAQQRFFNQVMTSMQTPTVITAMEKDIADGRAPVVQLVGTGEAATDRALQDAAKEGRDTDDLDISPRETLMMYLQKSFPTQRHEEYETDDGGTAIRPVTDAAGNPVQDPQAVKMRDDLLAKVGLLRIPESPIDMIANHFGTDVVAEATSREQRLVFKTQPDGTVKKVPEKRGAKASVADTDAFQGGKKKIMVFSQAGSTGRSYHADRAAANQKPRVHYLLQPGWQANVAVQGLGRTHRTNQVQAPEYKLVEIDSLKGQKRFVSTIARRLDQLGALTKGERRAGSGGLFAAADNLEGKEATAALDKFFDDLEAGTVPGLNWQDTADKLGLAKKRGSDRLPRPDSVPQFLNRLLSLRVNDQAAVFDAFDTRLREVTEQAVKDGKVDTGLANYPAERVTPVASRPVYRDPDTGAEVTLHTVTARRKTTKTPFDPKRAPLGHVVNRLSGQVWAVSPATDFTDVRTGRVIPRVRITNPSGRYDLIPKYQVTSLSNYESVDLEAARQQWQTQYDALPEYTDSEEHFLSGALLKVWDRLPQVDQPKIWRVKPDGQRTIVGRQIPASLLPDMLKRFGMTAAAGPAKTFDPADVHRRVVAGGRAEMAGGWKLSPARVQNETRIELTGISPADMAAVETAGAVREMVNWRTRYFIPTSAAGAEVLKRVAALKPVTSVTDDFRERFTPTVSPAVLTAIRTPLHGRRAPADR